MVFVILKRIKINKDYEGRELGEKLYFVFQDTIH